MPEKIPRQDAESAATRCRPKRVQVSVSDLSQARESLSYAFFRDAGVPAPRTSIAELTLTVPGKYDKELVGVYTRFRSVAECADPFEQGEGNSAVRVSAASSKRRRPTKKAVP